MRGNYNILCAWVLFDMSFTIPRNARELQPELPDFIKPLSFTIPRNARELQLSIHRLLSNIGFTIPRNARELQLSSLYPGTTDEFYHTKKCEGTTTLHSYYNGRFWFYHTKKCEGTTTKW